MNTIEVCLSPLLFSSRTTNSEHLVVIVDVLRATSAFCAAFDSGVRSIIPLAELEELFEYKMKGYPTAAEREGEKVNFADFGNSPVAFLQSDLRGKDLAYSTTNGTQAVEPAKSSEDIVTAAFVNLDAVCEWVTRQDKDVVILCSGWKNTFSLEDTLCAGAIIETLEATGDFEAFSDASLAALVLWQNMKGDLIENTSSGSHFQRLLNLGQHPDLAYCFNLNSSIAVPVWDGSCFRNSNAK